MQICDGRHFAFVSTRHRPTVRQELRRLPVSWRAEPSLRIVPTAPQLEVAPAATSGQIERPQRNCNSMCSSCGASYSSTRFSPADRQLLSRIDQRLEHLTQTVSVVPVMTSFVLLTRLAELSLSCRTVVGRQVRVITHLRLMNCKSPPRFCVLEGALRLSRGRPAGI